jgi:hypothetical protein
MFCNGCWPEEKLNYKQSFIIMSIPISIYLLHKYKYILKKPGPRGGNGGMTHNIINPKVYLD